MKDFSLVVDGLKINGKIFRNTSDGKQQPAILFIHGWESKQDRMFMLAEELGNVGYCCVTFDMRGHGTSEGDHEIFSRREFLKDVLAAYDFLVTQEQVDPNRVVAVGSSFGGYMAALLTAERKLQGIVLRVPADYRDQGFDGPQYGQRNQREHLEWKETLHSDQETAALRAVHNFGGHLLIVESGKDELVPAATVQSYKHAVKDSHNLTYAIMPDAPHSISRNPELQRQFADMVSNWLKSLT